MSKLQELIDRLCPDGVPFKPLRDLCEIKTGKGITKKDASEEGIYPIISGGQTPMGMYHKSNRQANTITISRVGAYAGFVSFIKEDFYLNDKCFSVIPFAQEIYVPFLFYYLKHIEEKIKELQSEGGVPTINTVKVGSLIVPIPPIEVQEEIVKILDRFADYAAELQARKEQYEYYRNLLLTFNPSAYGCGTDDEQKMNDVTTWGGHSYKIAWKAMGEIGTFIRGKRFVRTDIVDNGIPCIHYGDMYTHYGLYAYTTPGFINDEVAKKMRYANKNDVVIVAAGENKDDLGNALAWLGDEPAAVHDACFIFKSDMYPNFVSHVCRSLKYHKQVRMYANEAKICSVSGTDLAKVIIPVPEYELQVKIASILDRFETLVNDLTNGLPAEIAAVKEQYEYYRNRLLTFKELSA